MKISEITDTTKKTKEQNKGLKGAGTFSKLHCKSVTNLEPESRFRLTHQVYYQVMIYAIFYKHAKIMLL